MTLKARHLTPDRKVVLSSEYKRPRGGITSAAFPCTEVPEIRIKTAIIRRLDAAQGARPKFWSQMSTKIKTAVVVASAGVLLFSLVGGLSGVRASNDGAYRQMEVYSEVLSRVRSEYVEDPNLPLVTDGALHGLLESLDSNSSYLNAQQYKDYKASKTKPRRAI